MKKVLMTLCAGALIVSSISWAAEEEEIEAKSIAELLQLVREGKIANRRTNERREREFLANKSQQQKEVRNAQTAQRREEARSERLEAQFEKNEQNIAAKQEILQKRLGSLRELFGVLQQVSGDTQGVVEGSIVSAEYPGRGEWLGEFAQSMGRSSKLASIQEIEQLWTELQHEMTESGKVTRFTTEVTKLDGSKAQQEVIRVGDYNLISNGEYVAYDLSTGLITELPKQPSGRFVSSVSDLESAASGFVPFALDPTRGQLLQLQIEVPTIEERIRQGGTPGYVIIALGIIALLLSIERFYTLTIVGRQVDSQIASPDEADTSNPLGRIRQVYHDNPDIDAENLVLKLDEAILKEEPSINARIAFIKIISMVAPLLGLLGTVIGMIVTFQAITLFGTGDPKTMAGGISQALITTVLGLVVAIPTVLLHSIVNARAISIKHVLTEQSAGLIAQHAEKA